MTQLNDPVSGLADERLLELAADLTAQLEKKAGTRPVLWMLARQRQKAAESIGLLMRVDPTEPEAIRILQNDVRLYEDMIASCRALVASGRDAYAAIEERDRDEITEIVMTKDDQQLYGFNQEGTDR